jgi:type IV secretion system protein VirD4
MIIVRLMLIATVFVTAWSLAVLTAMMPGVVCLTLLIGLGCLIARRRYQLTAFGTARFAGAADLRRAGMLDSKNGLIIGRVNASVNLFARVLALFNPLLSSEAACQQFFRKRTGLVRLSKAVHTAVFAPTGAGKGTSCIVPFLMTCPDSAVVIDCKGGENARLTAEFRRKKFGHKIVLLDPFKVVTQTPDTLNPLSSIDKDSPFSIDDSRETSAAIVERKEEKGDGVHFLDNAEAAIAAMTAMVVQFGEDEHKSLQTVCDIVSNPDKWQKAIELMCASDAWQGMLARMGGNLAHLKERELASTMSTISRFLRFLSTPAIAASTRTSSFDPAEIHSGKFTAYLVLPTERASALSPLLRLWIGTFLRAVVRGGLQEKRKIHFICDEANKLGKMDQISDALTVGRGFGLRMQLYYQDIGEVKKCWPDGADTTLMANVTQVYFGTNDNETGKYESERLGEETIIVGSGGTSTGTSHQSGDQGQRSTSYSTNGSDNWSQQGRRLLKPEEVMALPDRIAITFTPGVPPICSRLVRYYEQDFRESWLRKLFARARMVVVSAALLLFALMTAALILSPLLYYRHPQPPIVIDDPLEGLDTRPFERR